MTNEFLDHVLCILKMFLKVFCFFLQIPWENENPLISKGLLNLLKYHKTATPYQKFFSRMTYFLEETFIKSAIDK